MKKALILALSLIMLLSFAACGSTAPAADTAESANTSAAADTAPAKNARVLKIHVGSADTSPINRSLQWFADQLAEKSNGALTGQVYGNSQLAGGNQTTAIDLTQSGDIEVGVICGVVQASMMPDFNLTLVPWIFDDLEMVDTVLANGTDVFQKYYDEFMAKDLVLLAFGENGFRQVTNNVRAINAPEDMDNIKIRVLGNQMLQAVYTALGSNPTDYNFNELYTALQQGTVDGQENPVTTIIIPSKFYEVQKYMSLWDICYDTENMCMGKETWDSFSEEEQAIIQECAIAWAQYNKDLARGEEEEGMKMLKDYMEISTFDAAQKATFKAIADPVNEQFVSQWDSGLYDAITAYSK